MKIAFRLRAVIVLVVSTTAMFAAHPFLCTDSVGGKVALVSATGVIEWEYACKHPQDCWMLPSGNILFWFATGALEL
ncbi:MAG: hypothetical protein RLZZ15_825, partial [Verrucomicrobiota bacterium]